MQSVSQTDSTRQYQYVPESASDFMTGKTPFKIPALIENIGVTARITAYLGTAKNVKVPRTLDGITVKSIGDGAFAHSDVNHVILPDTILALCRDAFLGCRALKTVTLSKNLEHIGECCFMECGLKSVSLPDGILEIPKGAFYKCESLSSLTLGNKLKEIGWGGFGACASLTQVILPDSLKRLDFGAFIFDPIKEIIFPAGVKEVSAGIFNWGQTAPTVVCVFKGGKTRIIDAGATGVGDNNEFKGRVENFYGVKKIYCLKDSRAERYAREHMITVRPLSDFKRGV